MFQIIVVHSNADFLKSGHCFLLVIAKRFGSLRGLVERSRNFTLREVSKFYVCEQKSQREEDILVVLSLTTIKYLSLVLKKNGIIQTILQITEIGGSIGAKIKRMVLTPLGSSNISRIPGG